jgi:hypothetical protein
VADIYKMKIQLSFDLIDMQVLKQTFTFVHPMAILAAKMENPPVDLAFDLKVTTQTKIDKLLEVNALIGDNMRANFNQKLDNLLKEAIKFAVTSTTGGDY